MAWHKGLNTQFHGYPCIWQNRPNSFFMYLHQGWTRPRGCKEDDVLTFCFIESWNTEYALDMPEQAEICNQLHECNSIWVRSSDTCVMEKDIHYAPFRSVPSCWCGRSSACTILSWGITITPQLSFPIFISMTCWTSQSCADECRSTHCPIQISALYMCIGWQMLIGLTDTNGAKAIVRPSHQARFPSCACTSAKPPLSWGHLCLFRPVPRYHRQMWHSWGVCRGLWCPVSPTHAPRGQPKD